VIRVSLLKLTYIEDVVEELAKHVLGSDKLNEALSVIAGVREALGHEAPEPYTPDTTPPAAKDAEIAQLSGAVQALLDKVATLEAAAPPAEPVEVADPSFTPDAPAPVANPFEPAEPAAPAAG
jgi:hypothetical protein